MKLKDWLDTLLVIWSNVIATIALIVSVKNGKTKTASVKPVKRKRKR